MAATTKAATMGAVCMLLALAISFFGLGIATRAIATAVFLFMTAPIAAHMIGRAAYFTGVELWEGTEFDELHGRYDQETHRLASVRKASGLRQDAQRTRARKQ
jgi:multicomponent Na+:H+ antiporter subunit G